MAYELCPQNIGIAAGADLSAKQYKFITAAGVVAGDGAAALGVLQNNPGNTQAATIAVGGVSMVQLGGTVAVGDNAASDANGDAVVATTGEKILGTFLQAGVVGDIVAMLVRPGAANAA